MKSINLWVILLLVSLFSGCGESTNVKMESQDYSQVNEYVPDKMAENNMLRGIEYMRLGMYDVALNKLEMAIKLDEKYAEGHNALAVLHERLGQNDRARQHYEKAVVLKPLDSDIQNNYGQFLCKRKQGQWQEADAHFRTAVENPVYRTPEIPYTNAGMCALRNNHLEQAEGYLRKALQINSQFVPALHNMAILSYDRRRYTLAQDYLQRYLKVAKQTSQTLWLGIRIARALNDRDTEASYARLLRSQFPDSDETASLDRSSVVPK
ncbi:MAG: type IV pilus biogenesis/stability protein PilW [Beggiatoa sp. IS2]|nr:MAG: type IV pilus biogenesis/stability protein PilW [Beggiatoa sp. IS2]